MRLISDMLEPGMNVAELIDRGRNDFKFFFENILGYNQLGGLNNYKQEWFNTVYDNDYVMIKAPSGFAKTVVLGVAFPLWWGTYHDNQKILLISKSLRQSKDALLLQIRDLIDDNELLKKLLKPETKDAIWNQTHLKTKNKCEFFNRAFNINIKGARANIIILDEIDSYPEPNIYFDYVVTRLIPGGKIIGISTPEDGSGTLMKEIEARDKDYGIYVFKTYTAIIDYSDYDDLSDGKSIWEENFSMKFLMQQKSIGKHNFYKNYMVDERTEVSGSVVRAIDVEKCIKLSEGNGYIYELHEGEIYIGVDVAISPETTGDFDTYVVVQKIKDTGKIIHAERIKGGHLQVPDKVRKLEELNKRYNPVAFIIDQSSFGVEVIRQARDKGLPVEAQDWQASLRNQLLTHLFSLIAHHKIIICKDRDDLQSVEFTDQLEYEILKFKEISNEKNYKSLVSKGSHDDSLCSGTSIIVKNGMIKDIEDIKVGEEVLTHKGNYKKVLNSMSKECDRDIITITPYGNLPISVTDNHKIFVLKKDINDIFFRKGKNKFEIFEVNSQDVDKNKHLLISPINRDVKDIKYIDLKEYIPSTNGWEYNDKHIWNYRWKEKLYKRFIPIDKDFCFFIGHFAGDGCYKGDIAFNKKDVKLKDRIKLILESYGINVREYDRNNSFVLDFRCIPLQNFLKKNVKSKLDKQIPDFCMELNPILQKEIFEGYRLADGSIQRGRLVTATISKKLAYQMKYILLRNNIIASLRKLKRKRYEIETLDQYWLEFNKVETDKYFCKKYGIDQARSRIVGDYLISCISSVKKEKKITDVYDIEVEDDYSFVAEGTAIHNCVAGLAMAVKHIHLIQEIEDDGLIGCA